MTQANLWLSIGAYSGLGHHLSTQFVSAPFQEWLKRVGGEPIRIYLGSP